MESKRPTNDFSIAATPSPEMWRKLMYMAASGSDVMLTPFETIVNGETKQEIQKRKDRESYERITVALASAERIAQFRVEIKEIDTQRSELLDRVRQKLRETREELKQLRNAAPEVTMPDGSRKKVYRDFGDVRTEAGELIDPAIIRAEAVSNDPLNLNKLKHRIETEQRLGELESRVERNRMQDAQTLTDAEKGKLTDEEIGKYAKASRKAVAEEASEFDQLLRQAPESPTLREKTFQTGVAPSFAFKGAADPDSDRKSPASPDDLKPPSPASASMPALK